MNRVTQAVIAALGLAVGASAFARYNEDEVRMRVRDSFYDYARVVNVDRIAQSETQPVTREECWKEPHEEYHPGTSYHRQTEQPIPGSYNNTVVRDEYVEKPGYYTRNYEDRCETRTEYQSTTPRTVAFDVVYRYDGQDYHERMSHDPGSRVRVHVDNGYVELAE
ncbi:MAG TPA: hypothetical protein VN689_10745 [Burkholderiales bacterium]|jgi:uncharacterized protein YcfJ|nr:hypothetical protein [Burkholderiales bacterium]